MKQYISQIDIPTRISTLHKLAYYLLREYLEEENYKYSVTGKYDILFENANAYGVGLYRACSVTAKDVFRRFQPKLNSKNSQQFEFIIKRHLETIVAQVKQN